VRWLSVRVGLNPTGRLVSHTFERAQRLTVRQLVSIGVVSIAYGVLELVEGVGLWKRRQWAEYLTIVATSLFAQFESRPRDGSPSPRVVRPYSVLSRTSPSPRPWGGPGVRSR
jgi:hypothetical protein